MNTTFYILVHTANSRGNRGGLFVLYGKCGKEFKYLQMCRVLEI